MKGERMIKEIKMYQDDAWGGWSEYELVCDKCKKSFGFYHAFKHAVDGKKEQHFKSIRKDNRWIELCSECSSKQ